MTSPQRRRWVTPLDLVDVFVYLTVLNLANQFVPAVITETFVVSILTAILFKVILEIVLVVKKRVVGGIRTAPHIVARVLGVVLLFAVLAGSKFVVLLLVDVLFGDAVSLGGFFAVTLLIVVLMGSRALVRIAFEGRRWDGAA